MSHRLSYIVSFRNYIRMQLLGYAIAPRNQDDCDKEVGRWLPSRDYPRQK